VVDREQVRAVTDEVGQSFEATPAACDADLDRLRSLGCIKWARYPDNVIPAWVADMDFRPAPSISRAVRALADTGDFGYHFAAHAEIPDAFCDWQERRHGWRPDRERVRLFCDVMQAVETMLWLHTRPGDGVVLFTPVYHPFFPAVTSTGRRIIDCPLAAPDYRVDPERLSAAIDDGTRAILLCNPHNPTGRVFGQGELAAIAEVAERHDLLVVSDEIWQDLVHPDARHICFASLGDAAAERTVLITAASKAFNIAGLHCAVAHVGHAGIASQLDSLPRHLLGAVGSPGAVATLAAWRSGEAWLEQVRSHLTALRDHLAARLTGELPEVGFDPPEATYLAWLDFRDTHLAADPAGRLLDEARVALSAGSDFGVAGAGFARLNFATSQELLDEIVDRIVAVLR
jgi:cystathionine beta-lyase